MTADATVLRPEAPHNSPSASLAAMYALVFGVVACVAVSAGELLYLGKPTFSASGSGKIDACAARFPLSDPPPFYRCVAGVFRGEGVFVLGVAGLVLSAAMALTVAGPWLSWWRFVRGRPETPGAVTRARFEMLCDRSRLTGRRRPALSGPLLGRSQAFTIALPGRRPLVVIPLWADAAAQNDPDLFDALIVHELAHVRAGDASWASCVRWIGRLTVPVVAAACLPAILAANSPQVSRTALIQAASFTVITVTIAAWLLRRRELAADSQVLTMLRSPGVLRRWLSSGRGRKRWSDRLRLFAAHPSVAARVKAADGVNADVVLDGGLVYALVVGAVTALMMNAAFYVTWDMDVSSSGWLPGRVSAAVGGLALGFGLTPALIRRADSARRHGLPVAWWRPTAGVAAGVLAGSLIPPATAPSASAIFAPGGVFQLHGAFAVLMIASVAAGMTTLGAGLADAAAEAGLPGQRFWFAAVPAAALSFCVAGALWLVPQISYGGRASWDWVVEVLAADKWRWLALGYPAAALFVAVVRVTRKGRGQARARGAWLTPATAGLAAATIFLPRLLVPADAPQEVLARAEQEQWWLCALAGWGVLIIVLIAHGLRALPRAWASAWLTIAVIGVEFTAYRAVTGRPHGWPVLADIVIKPSVWLFYLAVPASCLALLGGRRLRTAWAMPAAATVGAALIAALVAVAGLPRSAVVVPVAVPPPTPTYSPTVPPLPSMPAQAGQVLTEASAKQVIVAVSRSLPSTWLIPPPAAPSRPVGRSVVNPAVCTSLMGESFLRVLGRPVAARIEQYRVRAGVIPLGSESLTVEIESFQRPVPSSLLTAADAMLRPCGRFTVTYAGQPDPLTARAVAMPIQGASTWRADFTVATGIIHASETYIVVYAGHTLILLDQATSWNGAQPGPDEVAINTALASAINALP